MTEPEPPDPNWPRYSPHPFPSYRFIPGQTPHPRRNPLGHSYGQPEPKPTPFSAARWHTSKEYLYGIDLYNYAYWWECHEIFEGLWHAADHHSEQENFFQALIQFAAANLKRFTGNPRAAGNLVTSGIARFQKVPKLYMGIDVARFTDDFQRHMVGSDFRAPLIRLHGLDRMR